MNREQLRTLVLANGWLDICYNTAQYDKIMAMPDAGYSVREIAAAVWAVSENWDFEEIERRMCNLLATCCTVANKVVFRSPSQNVHLIPILADLPAVGDSYNGETVCHLCPQPPQGNQPSMAIYQYAVWALVCTNSIHYVAIHETEAEKI